MRPLAAVVAAALLLAGCSSATPDATASNTGDISMISVGVSDTNAPSLVFDTSVDYTETQTSVMWDGEGAPLVDGQPILLDIYGESLTTGETLVNTYDGLPEAYILAPELVGQEVYEELVDAHVGARILHVAPQSDEFPDEDAIVLVIDVLPERATGTIVEPRPEMPQVTLKDSGEPTITVPKGQEPPAELTTATLIQGEGAQIHPGSQVMVNYKGVNWEDGEEFDSSWPAEMSPYIFTIGDGTVLRGWDEGLVDQTVGSQVELVIPPSYGYQDGRTLVFVVDILDAWVPEE